MLSDAGGTPMDIRFGLFGTRVTVSAWFWLFSAILGWRWLELLGIGYLLLYVACVFVSILLHEFGHIWAGKFFGSDGDILLYSFGGLAIGSNALNQRWQRVIVSLAGPAIQLILAGLMYVADTLLYPELTHDWPRVARFCWAMMFFINFYWALINLLPVWPLDGGMVCREFCEWSNPFNGTRVSLMISLVVAGFMAFNTLLANNNQPHVPYLVAGGMYGVILFASLAFESYMLLQQTGRNSFYDDRPPWEH